MKRGPSPTLKPVPIGAPVPLRREDLELLHQGNRSQASIKRLRASHHKIARLAARGLDNKAIAAYTGYTRERVGQLVNSPAMRELIAVYAEKVQEKEDEALDAYIALKTENMMAAERHIHDHIAELDEAGELLPVKTALAISADGADRTGYGKRETRVNVNVDLAAALERAIKRSGKEIKTVQGRTLPKAIEASHRVMAATPAPARPLIQRRA